MNYEWRVRTASTVEEFEALLNQLERDMYMVTYVSAFESGGYVAVAKLQR